MCDLICSGDFERSLQRRLDLLAEEATAISPEGPKLKVLFEVGRRTTMRYACRNVMTAQCGHDKAQGGEMAPQPSPINIYG